MTNVSIYTENCEQFFDFIWERDNSERNWMQKNMFLSELISIIKNLQKETRDYIVNTIKQMNVESEYHLNYSFIESEPNESCYEKQLPRVNK